MEAAFSSKMNIQPINDKIKILKVEPISNPQLKRRRSHSHNGADLYTNDTYKSSNNHSQFYIQPHKESSPNETSHLKQIMNNCNSPYLSNQLIKDKHKKETHNRVERKRRDFINCQIQRLAELLPSEFFMNCDIKMNKGVILKNSVEYITSMKYVEQINQQLIQENELGANLIRALIASNDVNSSQLSNTDTLNYTELNEIDIGALINQWYTAHQDNKQLLQQFSQKFSSSSPNSKNSNANYNDVVMENSFINDSKTNNSTVNTHTSSRKRYSSLPTNIGPDSQSQRCQNSNVQLISDKSSPILNSLLKKPNNHHNFTHNETLEPIYRIDSNDEGIDFYLRYSTSPVIGQAVTTDNALIIDTLNSENVKDCKFLYSKDKTYYILPKTINAEFITKMEDNSGENCPDKLNSLDPSDQFNQSNDPMLLSTSPTHL